MDIKNYAACFIDLLGQKSALHGQGMIPDSINSDAYQTFELAKENSIRHIKQLHENTDAFFLHYRSEENAPKDWAPEESKKAIRNAASRIQRWSDGVVAYTSIEPNHKKLSMVAVHEIFMYAGVFCLNGLALRQPLRGGMEFSWGWERNNCEIYGAVVANAYTEEKKAKLGRISVGPICVDYLQEMLSTKPTDKYHDANRRCAKSCLDMLYQEDNDFFIDYLGEKFYAMFFSSNQDVWLSRYQVAVSFIREQIFLHESTDCLELVHRYKKLLAYFELRSKNFE